MFLSDDSDAMHYIFFFCKTLNKVSYLKPFLTGRRNVFKVRSSEWNMHLELVELFKKILHY